MDTISVRCIFVFIISVNCDSTEFWNSLFVLFFILYAAPGYQVHINPRITIDWSDVDQNGEDSIHVNLESNWHVIDESDIHHQFNKLRINLWNIISIKNALTWKCHVSMCYGKDYRMWVVSRKRSTRLLWVDNLEQFWFWKQLRSWWCIRYSYSCRCARETYSWWSTIITL
jgi:hypothetical protein